MRLLILVAAACLFFACAYPAASRTTGALDAVLSADDWLNGAPTQASVRGKVVLVDFYTFDCINCKHVQPNLRELYRAIPRSDLVILGVHSPETRFEKVRSQLIASMKDQGVVWPVAVDNDFKIWNSYAIGAWPTQLIFDRSGRLRATIVGDSQDALIDGWVSRLVRARS